MISSALFHCSRLGSLRDRVACLLDFLRSYARGQRALCDLGPVATRGCALGVPQEWPPTFCQKRLCTASAQQCCCLRRSVSHFKFPSFSLWLVLDPGSFRGPRRPRKSPRITLRVGAPGPRRALAKTSKNLVLHRQPKFGFAFFPTSLGFWSGPQVFEAFTFT